MACGGCGNKANIGDKPTFENLGPKNNAMRMLLKRNGIKLPSNVNTLSEEQRNEILAKKQNVVMNLGRAAFKQKSPFKWFKDGITGLIKCVTNDLSYSDEEIKGNREACRGCEHATKDNGELTLKSQCMAPDPEQNGAPCGCFIVCKSMSGKCPLNKFVSLTISTKSV